MPVTLDLIREHADLIAAIQAAGIDPVMVNLDTLNRSLFGSENSDEDMGGYVRAADAIREAFNCAVPIVHHCGHRLGWYALLGESLRHRNGEQWEPHS
jgi:AAA domain